MGISNHRRRRAGWPIWPVILLILLPGSRVFAWPQTMFEIDPNLSSITLSGGVNGTIPFEPQFLGSLTTQVGGALFVDDSDAGQITFLSSGLLKFAEQSSPSWPVTEFPTQFAAQTPGAYNGQTVFETIVGSGLRLTTASTIPVSSGNFEVTTLDWQFSPQFFAYGVPELGYSFFYPSTLENISASPGVITNIGGTPQLTIPIRVHGTTAEPYIGVTAEFELTGQIVARPVVDPTPLHMLSFPTNDLVYSEQTGLIYATVPADANHPTGGIAKINPITKEIGATVGLDGNPNELVIATDGSMIHVVTSDRRTIEQFNPATLTSPLKWDLSSPGDQYPDTVSTIDPVPGKPAEVLVSLSIPNLSPHANGVVIFQDGVPLPSKLGGGPDLTTIDPSGLTGYGYENSGGNHFFYFDVADDGLHNSIPTSAEAVLSGPAGRIAVADGKVFSDAGQIADLITQEPLGTFLGARNFLLDAELSRLFTVETEPIGLVIRSYDVHSLALIGSYTIKGLYGETTSSLIRVGDSSLAFRDTNGLVFFVDLAAVPEPSTLALAGIGAIALFARGVRRRSQSLN